MTTPQNTGPATVSQAYLDELAIFEEDLRATQAVLEDPNSCFDSIGALVDFEDHTLRVYAARGLELIGVIRTLCGQQTMPPDVEQEEPVLDEIPDWVAEWNLEKGEQLVLGEEAA